MLVGRVSLRNITTQDNVDTTLTWASRTQKYDVTLLQFNVSVCGVQDLPAPLLLRRLLARLLLHGRSQSISMRTDPCDLQQFCNSKQSHRVSLVTDKYEELYSKNHFIDATEYFLFELLHNLN